MPPFDPLGAGRERAAAERGERAQDQDRPYHNHGVKGQKRTLPRPRGVTASSSIFCGALFLALTCCPSCVLPCSSSSSLLITPRAALLGQVGAGEHATARLAPQTVRRERDRIRRLLQVDFSGKRGSLKQSHHRSIHREEADTEERKNTKGGRDITNIFHRL